MNVVAIGRVNGQFRGRQPEYQPAAAAIDMGKFQHITKKRTVGIRVRAVDDCVRAVDHVASSRPGISPDRSMLSVPVGRQSEELILPGVLPAE